MGPMPTCPETAKGRPGHKRARAKRARWTGAWREAKGFRFYLLADDRIVQVLSWHQVQTDEAAAAALQQVKAAGLSPVTSTPAQPIHQPATHDTFYALG
jgi:hypothetical protein